MNLAQRTLTPTGKGTVLSFKEAETLEMVKKRVDFAGARTERNVFEQSWLKNIAFYLGKHYLYVQNGVLTVQVPEDMPEHKVLYKVNLCKSALLRAAAKVLNISATFKAVPMSGSMEHRNTAETSERLFAHLRNENDWNGRIQLFGTMWAGLCGSGFYKVNWDQLSGKPQRFYFAAKDNKTVLPTALLSRTEQQKRDLEGIYDDIAEGDVRFAVHSPFGVFHDWTSRDQGVLGCRWMADSHYVDKETVAETFGVDTDDLSTDEGSYGLARYEEAIAFMSSFDWAAPLTWSDPQDKRGKRCRLVDMYERPGKKHPKGRRVVYAGGRIIHDGPNPYAGDLSKYAHLPYIKQDWAPAPGRFWGCSLIEDLTNPNYHINETRSAMLELVRIFGRPRTYIWSDSGLNKDEMTRDAGGVYVINRMSKPPVADPPVSISPEVAGIGATCQGDLNMLASQADADQGTMPAQLRSGEAVQQMIEYRDIALSITSRNAIMAARDVGRVALGICKLYYNEPRVLRYLGTDSEWNFIDFAGADLSNDIVIVGEPSITDTEAKRRSEVLDAIQAGALNPAENPVDRDYVLSALHYSDSDHVIKAKLRAQKHQEDEIRTMIANPQRYAQVDPETGLAGYPVAPYEDHQREIEVLVNFFYTQEFRMLPPLTRSVLVMHWQAHANALAMQMQQQMMAMEASKGTPGAKGKPSPAK